MLLGTVAPHNPIVTCSAARWLKLIMKAADVDVDSFKAHSTRSASTSKAFKHGLAVEQIVKRANFSHASTFHRFYNKSMKIDKEDNFQLAVLHG